MIVGVMILGIVIINLLNVFYCMEVMIVVKLLRQSF